MNVTLQFSTKADTLKECEPYLRSAKILQQICITMAEWRLHKDKILQKLEETGWHETALIVRSSARNEDTQEESMAGKFTSVLNITGISEIEKAVNKVIESYTDCEEENQVLLQPMLINVKMSGVAFSIDPNNGGNYIVINYDDDTGTTNAVTSGNAAGLRTFYYFKGTDINVGEPIDRIIRLVKELESLFHTQRLDMEFAIDQQNELYLLQVRPLTVKVQSPSISEQQEILERISAIIRKSKGHKPFLYGEKTVYGVMPDWNPAEIIGIRPRALAMSLYKELVTDYIWAYQRDNYGYKNLRSFPLLIDFGGVPYIDVRVSFNSFLAKEMDDNISEKLVNYYIDQLITNKKNHDKVEFEIIFSCFTFDLEERIQVLKQHGFSDSEINSICHALKQLTNRIVDEENGYLRKDLERIGQLSKRREEILNGSLDTVSKIFWLLEDCKRYGTLPFAGLARGGFIAVQMLQSLKTKGILSDREYNDFMGELDTVSSQMARDFYNSDKTSFMKKYGHLRPGTYDILSCRYDEDEGRYFDFSAKKKPEDKKNFFLSLTQLNNIKKLLEQNGLNNDVLKLFDFFKFAIEGREYAKFIFTKNLSDALSLFGKLGEESGFSKEDISYANIDVIYKAYSSEADIRQLLKRSIIEGKQRHKKTLQINMPAVIVDEKDVWRFFQQDLEPNYITLKKGMGEVASIANSDEIDNKIIFIENADPGYDWIFSKNIVGFVTMYGGANSHMAIRAGELSIPAVIGVGESKYRYYSKANILEIDCEAKNMRILK